MALLEPTRGIISASNLNTDAEVLPALPGMGFIVEKTPEFSTSVKRSSSGREIRTARYASPLWNFQLTWDFLRNDPTHLEVAKLLGSFAAQMGRFGCFFMLDGEDYQATNETIGIGDGSTTVFQLVRTIGAGTIYNFPDPVRALWQNPTVTVNGVTKTIGTDYSVAPWGVITFTSPPPSGQVIRWSGKFLFVCRFDTDRLSIKQIVSQLWSQDGLPIVSLKP